MGYLAHNINNVFLHAGGSTKASDRQALV